MAEIPAEFHDLFQRPILASLATILPEGQPQVTPVWCDLHEGKVRVNTAAGRQKHRDMAERPQVTVLVLDPDNAFRYLEVRGRVTEITEEGGDAHIDALAKKYLGADSYPFRNPAETRLVCTIEPSRVTSMG